MEDVVQWLGEQLDEDERIARVAATLPVPTPGAMSWRSVQGLSDGGGSYWCVTTTPPDDAAPTVELVGSGMSGGGVHMEATARHIAEHDPARVLREIDAKRKLLVLHRPVRRTDFITSDGSPAGTLEVCHECDANSTDADWPDTPCWTLRLLAVPYADRTGYKEDWRP